MSLAKEVVQSFSHIFFPHVCAGCGNDLSHEQLICLRCIQELPVTDFTFHAGNPVEKIFWGRVDIHAASAQYYFTKNSSLQHILHRFKYNSQRQLGVYFGKLMGEAIRQSNRFTGIEALIPLPLFASREKIRGYNQAAVLCEGIAPILAIPVLSNLVTRIKATATQTHKNRMERWQNINGKFEMKDRNLLAHKHVLLVDDVITTGATLDACATELLHAEGIKVSVAALAYTVG